MSWPDLPLFVYLLVLVPLALFYGLAGYMTLKVRAAREWTATPGRVVRSRTEQRDVKVFDDSRYGNSRTEQRNFAKIVYEYTARGQKLTNDRVSIGEDLGNFQVAETIRRYPVGREVTVYYNPRKPQQAVLERDLPKGLWGCLGIGTAIVLAVFVVLGFGAERLVKTVSPYIAHNPERGPMVLAFCGFALFIALFAWALQRQAALSRTWPTVKGRIQLSGIQSYQAVHERSDGRREPGVTMYERKVMFNYVYDGLSYTNMHSSVAESGVTSNVKKVKSWLSKGYEDGQEVTVFVNPENPSEATIDPRVPFVWILWACVALFVTGAGLFAVYG